MVRDHCIVGRNLLTPRGLLVRRQQIEQFNADLIGTDATTIIERRFIANQFGYSYSALYALLLSTGLDVNDVYFWRNDDKIDVIPQIYLPKCFLRA